MFHYARKQKKNPILCLMVWEVTLDKLVSFVVVFQQYTVSHSNEAVMELLILSCDSDDPEYFLRHFTFGKLWMPDATHIRWMVRQCRGKYFWVHRSYSLSGTEAQKWKASESKIPDEVPKPSMAALMSWERGSGFFFPMFFWKLISW